MSAAASKSVFGQIDMFAEAMARQEADTFALPSDVILHFERAGVKPEEIDKVVGPRSDLVKRIETHADLSLDQTDRALRLAHIVSLAERVFGAREKAFIWLRLKNSYLGQKPPIDCLGRETTTRFVEEALLRMEYAVYA